MSPLFPAVVFAALAACSASLIGGHIGGHATLVGPGHSGVLLKGPALKASLVGSDGSHISAVADAGALEAAPRHGGVVTAAVSPGHIGIAGPVVHAAPVLHAAPLLQAAPVLQAGPVLHAAPVLPAVAPVVHGHARVGTLIDGPSGTIKTSGNANGAILAPVGHAVGVAHHGTIIGGHGHGWGHHY